MPLLKSMVSAAALAAALLTAAPVLAQDPAQGPMPQH